MWTTPTKTATIEKNIAHVNRVVFDNIDFTVNQTANTVGISRGRVENILHNELGMSKVSARQVPRLLASDQTQTRLTLSQANLPIFEVDQASFVPKFLRLSVLY